MMKGEKLDSKTKRCTLLGYGNVQKGYCIFDHLNQKGRNILFNEQEMGTPPIEEEETPPQSLNRAFVDESDLDKDKEENTNEDVVSAVPWPAPTRKREPVDYYGSW